MDVEKSVNKSTSNTQDDKDKTDKSLGYEIVNEEYKQKDDNDRDDSKEKEKGKDKDKGNKKKKKSKHKKKDKKDDPSNDDPGPSKKVKSMSVLDNKNIPEELRQKCYEIEKNPLCVAIANIPIGSTKTELQTFFITLLTSLRPDLTNPIRYIEIGSTNNFAIMELDTKEIRDYCLTLENLELKGYKISIKKVKGFFNRIYDSEASGLDPFGNISTILGNDENKLYIGSIPLYLREEDIRKIAEAFGFLKYFNLVKDSEGNHKGYCFVEYVDSKSAEKAAKGLHEREIGDRKLKVQKAVAVTAPKMAIPTQGAKPTNASGSFLLGLSNIGDLSVQSMLNTPASARIPSKVVQILNMCTPEDLLEDDFYNDLLEDVKEEAQKFGPIDKIVIPRPDQKTGVVGPSVGKVYVKFNFLIPAKQARHRLAGRAYNQRTILTSFYPEDKFESQEYLTNPF